MKIFKKLNHRKKGFLGIEYVIVLAIVLVGGVGAYVNSQGTIKDNQKEASTLMSDKEADLQTDNGSSSGDLVSAISLTPDYIFLTDVGDVGSSIVKLTPDTSWRVKLKWEAFMNASYSNLTEENRGYKVNVKGIRKGISKYKVTTQDGSPASKQLVVQTGQPSEFTLSPNPTSMDMDDQKTFTLSVSEGVWDGIKIDSWEVIDGKDIISVAPTADKKSAVVSADGATNGGNASIKVSITDDNFGTKSEIFAQIKINKDYFTKFDLNKGSGTFGDLKAAATRTVTIHNGEPKRTGYTYKGWKLSLGGDIYQPGSTYKMPAQNNTMTAQWNANNYDIIYDLNYDGKRHSSKSQAYETELGTLPEPIRAGCKFIGWFTEKEGGTQITSKTTVPLNGATYYAHWSYNTYTITYDVNGGTGNYPAVSGKFNSTIQLNSAVPTRNFYRFGGWVASFDGKTYGAGVQYKIPYQNVIMKANWVPISYSIAYVTNGGTISGTPVTSYLTTDTVALPSISRTGYTFGGWFSTSNFSSGQATTIPKGSGGNKTFYAKWTANAYTLSFNGNGGSVGTSSKTVRYGERIGNMPTPSLKGHTFVGWYTSPSGGTQCTADTAYRTTSNSTLYAHWRANVYTITFNANGGSSVSKNTMTVTYGKPIGPMATAYRGSYGFKGWFNAANGGSAINANTVWWTAGNFTLYAQWTPLFSTVNVVNDIRWTSTYYDVPVNTSKYITPLTADGYGLWSYTSCDTTIATVSGSTVSIKKAFNVTLRSNWRAAQPWATDWYAKDSWGGRRRMMMTNNGADMTYYSIHTGNKNSTPSRDGIGEQPDSSWWSNVTASNNNDYGNAAWIRFKACGNTRNYDGTNRCSASNSVWVGADTTAPGGVSSIFQTAGTTGYWGFYPGGDNLTSTRIGQIKGSWIEDVNTETYSVYYGGSNSYYMSGGFKWGSWGEGTTHNHTRWNGCEAWLFTWAKSQDMAGNLSWWGA